MAGEPWGRLLVVELPDAYLVAREADPTDWLCRFDRAAGFPARRWAENMVRTYNERLRDGRRPAAIDPQGTD